jgi:hypothetical protein
VVAGCLPTTTLAPGASCTLDLVFKPNGAAGSYAAFVQIDAGSFGPYRFPVIGTGVGTSVTPIVDVIEYYNAALDHYFMSSLAEDITALDSGATKGWVRTGGTFRAYAAAQPGASAVCRYYLPPENGDSHFYSASASECADVRQKFPSFVLESGAVMHIALPNVATGACPAGSAPIYRIWNQRADSNHRYTTSAALRNQMVALGGLAEGYGSDATIMCAAP